jgi:hypothetical protein
VPFGRLIVIVTTLLCACSTSHAVEEVAAQSRAGLLWVKVALPGRAETLSFVFDSGASHSVIDLRAARRLGLALGASRRVRGIGGMTTAHSVRGFAGRVGTQSLPGKLLALDLSTLDQPCCARVDGLLGADFLRDRIVQVDFKNQRLRFHDQDSFIPRGGQCLSVSLHGGAICVKAALNERPPQWMRVDTGCNSALVLAGPVVSHRRSTPRASLAVSTHFAPDAHTSVQLGPVRIDRVPAVSHPQPLFPGEAGLLGTPLLGRFTVTFDIPHRRIVIE